MAWYEIKSVLFVSLVSLPPLRLHSNPSDLSSVVHCIDAQTSSFIVKLCYVIVVQRYLHARY